MAEGAPDVVIPVRLDNAKALRALDQLEQHGAQSAEGLQKDLGKAEKAVDRVGTEGQKAGQRIKQGMQTGSEGVSQMEGAVANLMKAQIGLAAIERVGQAMGTEFQRAADYVRTLAKDFSDLRQSLQQVAALTGKQNTDEFAVEQVQKATKASLTPEEWKGFQEQFQSYGGAYIEGDQSRFVERKESEDKYKQRVAETAKTRGISEEEAAKVTKPEMVSAEAQAEGYQQKIAEFSKARGINASDAAQLGGGLLQFSQGPQKEEDLESRFGKVFKTLERAPTPVAQLLPQMSRVMAQGASPEEASEMLAIMSEAMPGEEETGVTNTLKAIRNQTLEGKGEALGQKKGMTPLEQIKAATGAIQKRVAGGEDLDAILKDVAPDLRESRGIKGFMTRGLEAKGFERVEQYQKDTPADFVDTEVQKYEESDAGKKAKRDANMRLAKAQRGAKYQGVMAEREEAQTELVKQGEGEVGGLERVIRGIPGVFTGQSAEQQIESSKALNTVREKAKGAGVTDEEAFNRDASLGTRDVPFRSEESVNQEIMALLKLIAEHTQATAEHAKTTAEKTAAPKQNNPARGTPPAALAATPVGLPRNVP